MTHMLGPMRPDSVARQIPSGTPVFGGWILLLLMAFAGCRALTGPAAIIATEQGCRSAAGSADPRFSAAHAEDRSASAVNSRFGAVPPVRLASLESERATDATGALPHSLSQGNDEAAEVISWTILTLDNAIRLGLWRNPDLAAVRAGEPVAQAALRVAETYPWNPQFQTQVLPYSRDRQGNDGAVSQQHVVVQTFELGGQQRFRTGAASANRAQVSGAIQQAELTNAAQTTRLFFAVLYQRELRDMNRTLVDLNEQLVGIMRRREQAGQASNSDVELARFQAEAARRQQRLTEANYQTAVMNLRNQLNLDTGLSVDLPAQWSSWRWWPLDKVLGGSIESISAERTGDWLPPAAADGAAPIPQYDEGTLRQLVVNRPDVAAARAAAAMALENLRLAKAMRRPDLQVGPMWQLDDASTEFWGVQAQIDIPVVNTGAPLVAQRFAELRQQQIAAEQLENRAVLEARTAMQRYERARRFVEQSRGDFRRAIPDVLKPFEDQFRAGQLTLLQVFAARTALIQSRQSFLELLNELALAAADVAQTTGLPPQQLVTEYEPEPNPLEVVPRP